MPHKITFSMASTMSAPTAEQLQALLNSPALEAPPGESPNLIDPPNKLLQSRVDYVVCLVIATLVLISRLYTKVRVIKIVSAPDCKVFMSNGWK